MSAWNSQGPASAREQQLADRTKADFNRASAGQDRQADQGREKPSPDHDREPAQGQAVAGAAFDKAGSRERFDHIKAMEQSRGRDRDRGMSHDI